MTKLTFLCY